MLTATGPGPSTADSALITRTLRTAYIDASRRRFQELLNGHSILGMAIALSSQSPSPT
ncbi:hypothetical protein EMIT0324P_80065 [Pseudomonas chlororaphis]